MPKSAKKSRKNNALQSPLTAAAEKSGNEPKKERKRKVSKKRAKREAQEDQEEARLTSLIFGNGSNIGNNDINDSHDHDIEDKVERYEYDANSASKGGFEIDRSGDEDSVHDNDHADDGQHDNIEEHSGNEEEQNAKRKGKSKSKKDAANKNTAIIDALADANDAAANTNQPAWVDDDEEELKVNILDSSTTLRKLRKSRDEQQAKALSGQEFENRLRQRYQQTAQVSAKTEWARIGGTTDAVSTSAPVLASSQHKLPSSIIKMVRCPDANLDAPSNAVIRSTQFHPGSNPEHPIVMTAGLDKTLRFFRVNEDKSVKIHGIHFPKLPIYTASFLGDTGNVVLSGRRSYFYIYDSVAGKVDYIPGITGRQEKSFEQHVVSPDGKLIAFLGNDGYIVLVDTHSRQWIGSMKMNGSVRALTFTPDGQYIMGSGSDGDVYRFDINTRRCVERFSNNDGTISSSLACNHRFLAVGAESGVVNVYSELDKSRDCLRSVMNLRTKADALRFSHDGQILAMSTQREKNGLRLLHVPTQTVFSNWPTSKTPLGAVWSMDFSPQSRFLAVGNDKGKCLLYRVSHYESDE